MTKIVDSYGDSKDYPDYRIDTDYEDCGDYTRPDFPEEDYNSVKDYPQALTAQELEFEIMFNTQSAMEHKEYCDKEGIDTCYPMLVVTNG